MVGNQSHLYDTCIRFNQSDPFKIGNNYGGIPVNLVTNLIGLAILLILFFIIRKSTIRKVGKRMAKTTLDNGMRVATLTIDGVDAVTTRWTHLFFGGRDGSGIVDDDQDDDESEEMEKDDSNETGNNQDGDRDSTDGLQGDQDKDANEEDQNQGAKEAIIREKRPGSDEVQYRNKKRPSGVSSYGTMDNPDKTVGTEAACLDHDCAEQQELGPAASYVSRQYSCRLSRQDSNCSQKIRLKKGIKFLTTKEKKLEVVMGADAVQYLRFQKYIIIYIFITTAISLGIVLPVNFQGTLQGNATEFGHTTMANVDPKNPHEAGMLWVHIILAFLLFPLSIFLMRRFSIGLRMRDTSLGATRTLAIENIPIKYCTTDNIRMHFEEAYPDYPIKDIQLAYNVTKLIQLSTELRNTVEAKHYAQSHNIKHEHELTMIPVHCARCCFCCCAPCFNRVPCVEFYQSEENRLKEIIATEREIALSTKLGMAFVTFRSINHSRKVLRDHKFSILNLKHDPPSSSINLKPKSWKVWYAPPPSDIIWENLSDRREWLLSKKILVNVFIFFIAFFLTTPQFIVHQLDPIIVILKNLTANASRPHHDSNGTDPVLPPHPLADLPSWLTDFLPTILIWTFTVLLPALVAYSDRLLGHWTRSGENHAIMKKTFWYLIFMVIILPTFGLTSGKAMFDFLFRNFNSTNSDSDTARWDCIFLPDSGAFFVNYVITAALIGSGLELIRFPDLFWYLIQICCSRSKADTPAIRRAITYEFRFGEQYARMMLLFAMVVMYSIPCPLITPFGCCYFVIKHIVDRHNLTFVYARSKINRKIHATAINFVVMSVALLQFLMVVFSFIRSGNIKEGIVTPQTKVAIGLLILTINVCSAQIWSTTCKKISAIKYEDMILSEDAEEEIRQPYLPDVLKVPRPVPGHIL